VRGTGTHVKYPVCERQGDLRELSIPNMKGKETHMNQVPECERQGDSHESSIPKVKGEGTHMNQAPQM